MDSSTYDKLLKLHLKTMAFSYANQDSVPGIRDMTFDERFSLMVDAESDTRDNHKLQRRIKEAKFAESGAAVESIKYYTDRQLNREQFTELATNQYICKPRNILVVGATGSGKTYIVCALGNRACQANYKVRYIRMPDLFTELELAKAENTYDKVLKKFHNRDLLIIDEWLLYQTNEAQRQLILEVIEGRYRYRSTIISSQYEPEGWHEKLGGGAIADAIMDRITPKSNVILIHGETSMRTRE